MRITIHGRLSNVRWLEQPPCNAREFRDGQFPAYEIFLPDDADIDAFERKVRGEEFAWTMRDETLIDPTGCWIVRPLATLPPELDEFDGSI